MQAVFLQRRDEFSRQQAVTQQQYNQFALLRLGWFVLAVLAVYLLGLADQTLAAIGAGVVGLMGFLMLLKRHQRMGRERDRYRQLVQINADESGRLERRFTRPETGEAFHHPEHPYSGDLDVFGKHSLFRLLNRTHTYVGTRRLAAWLQAPASTREIRQRQEAVAVLAPRLDWRQDLEALAGLEATIGQSPEPLQQWVADRQPLPAYLRVVRVVLPLLTLGVVAAWLTGFVPGLTALGMLAVHGLVLSQVGKAAKAASEQTYEIARALGTFRDLFRQAEELPEETTSLQAIRRALTEGGEPASAATDRLARLVENFNFRRNPYFYLFVGLITLWDVQYLMALEGWREQYRERLAGWFDALGELEALNSLAGLAYAHPEYTRPEVVEEDLRLAMNQVRHPLLAPQKSVPNALTLAGHGNTILITGSNMSGKSTFLRTVGTNLVLALAGSVVAAGRFVCSPVRVFTSMRTQDSLEESTSSFYAELKRLRALLEQTRQSDPRPVLYFLDEILKGTNSADRHNGARALILQLHHTTATGFVSTHDVELGDLSATHPFVQNYSFHSDVVDGQLHFDYTLRAGVCRSFNASQLMRSIGIAMEDSSGS